MADLDRQKLLEEALAARMPRPEDSAAELERLQGDMTMARLVDASLQSAANARAAGAGTQATSYKGVASEPVQAELEQYLLNKKADRALRDDMTMAGMKAAMGGKGSPAQPSPMTTPDGRPVTFKDGEYLARNPLTGKLEPVDKVIRPGRTGGRSGNGIGAGKPLSEKAAENVANYDSINASIAELESMGDQINTGFYKTTLSELNEKYNPFYSPDAEDLKDVEIRAKTQGIVNNIKKALSGTAVSAQEMEDLMREVPGPKDDPAVFKTKLQVLKEKTNSLRSKYLGAQQATGRNVSGFTQPAPEKVAPAKAPATTDKKFDWED